MNNLQIIKNDSGINVFKNDNIIVSPQVKLKNNGSNPTSFFIKLKFNNKILNEKFGEVKFGEEVNLDGQEYTIDSKDEFTYGYTLEIEENKIKTDELETLRDVTIIIYDENGNEKSLNLSNEKN